MASGEWTFDAVDGQGVRLADLTGLATGKRVTFKRNTWVELAGTLSCDDLPAGLLTAAMRTGWPSIRAYRRAPGANSGAFQFEGKLAPVLEDAEVGATFAFVARSPLWRLGLFSLLSQQTGAAGSQPDGTTIANMLTYNGYGALAGLTIGNVDPLTTSHAYSFAAGASLLGSMQALTGLLDGVDIAERFVAPGSVVLDVMATAGSARPNAVFQYGDGTMANCKAAGKTTAPPMNYVVLIGADGLVSIGQDFASQAIYGVWPNPAGAVAAPATGSQAMLDSLAAGMLRPRPITTARFTPETNAPKPLDDFVLADTVSLYANRGSLQISAPARVNAFSIVIDDNGIESAEIPDPTSPEDEMGLRASLALEVTT